MRVFVCSFISLCFAGPAIAAQANSICDDILKWQNAQGLSLSGDSKQHYQVTLYRPMPEPIHQEISLISDGVAVDPASKCLELDRLAQNISIEVDYITTMPDGDGNLKVPIFLMNGR